VTAAWNPIQQTYLSNFMAQTLSSTVEAIHEDLADELALLDNENTIFSSTVQSGGRAENSVYQRVADRQHAGRLAARGESSATTRASVTNQFLNRKKINGVVQQKRETWGISKRVEKVENVAGVANVLGEARYRGLERHKQGKELTYLSQQVQADDSAVHNDEGVVETGVHTTQGASAWCESSAQTNSEYAVHADYRPSSAQIISVATASAFTETNLRTIIENARLAKNKNIKLTNFCTIPFASHLATFFDAGSTANSLAPIRRFNQDASDHSITSKLTGYNTMFGSMMVVPTDHLNGTRNAATALGTISGTSTTTITVTSTAGLQKYMKVSGTNVPAGAYIASITSATVFEISSATTGAISNATFLVGDFDYALFLDMEYFFEILNGLEEVDMSPDGTGTQGYVEEFFSLFCSMPYCQSKVIDS